MAAKGTEAKKEIFNQLQKDFSGAFWEDEGKILRIPLMENGTVVEIKVTLTAAKNILGNASIESAFQAEQPAAAPVLTEITEEEKENVAKLLASLNLS